MNKYNPIDIYKTNLTDQTKFTLNEITKIENYFIEEINQRKSCSKKLSKYATAFDYIDKVLTVLRATSAGVYHFFYQHCVSNSWNNKRKFYFNFFSNNRNNQKITRHDKKQKEKA